MRLWPHVCGWVGLCMDMWMHASPSLLEVVLLAVFAFENIRPQAYRMPLGAWCPVPFALATAPTCLPGSAVACWQWLPSYVAAVGP